MINNEYKLLTLKINENLNKSINALKNNEFSKTGNPSFKIFNNSLILGLYNGKKLPPYIEFDNHSIKINKRVNNVESVFYYNIEGTSNLLKDSIDNTYNCDYQENSFFPLKTIIKNKLFPLIFLGYGKCSNISSLNLTNTQPIDDFKIELIKVKLTPESVIYSVIDYRHLKNGKV